MKKIIILMALALVANIVPSVTNEVQAQSSASASLLNSSGRALDTVSNTATHTLFTQVTGYKSTITLQVDFTKISGTLAGTLTPVVSNDGLTYYPVPVRATLDSAFTVTDVAAQGHLYDLPKGYAYYGVKWTGSGTMSGSWKAKLVYRKE